MAEIVADNISIINSDELEFTIRLDAEYYLPEYINLENKILNSANYKLWKDIEGKFITGPFGSAFNVENYTKDSSYRYIRGKDVKDFFLLDDDNVYIPQKDFERLKKYSLIEGDILVSVVGTLGNTVIIDNESLPAIFSCKSTAFRTKAINPFFLIGYLNCQFGKKLLQRKVRGAVQTGLNINDLRLLPIYLPKMELQNEIAKLVINAKNNFDKSKTLYSQAESLLLEELGIKNIDLSHKPCYEVNSSDTISANRIDAEYYQPKYEKIVNTIKKYFGGFSFVKNEFVQVKDSFLKDNSKFYRYVEIGGIDISYGNIECLNLKGDKLPANAKIVTHGGELIISKVRPTRGAVTIIPEDWKEVICSGAFVVLKENGTIRKEVLNVFLKSIIGKELLGRPVTGTSYPTVDDKDVLELPIPLIKQKLQNQIAELLNESYSTYRRAQILLEEAKKKVEEMIEKGQED